VVHVVLTIDRSSRDPNEDEIKFDHDLRDFHYSWTLAECLATLALGVE